MEQASRSGKQGHIHTHDRSSAGHDQITTKPVVAGAIVRTNHATLISQKPYHQPSEEGQIINSKQVSKSQVWDCGSSLYDSFELNSFNRQLDSAIKASSRTLSMPHLTERRAPPLIQEPVPIITTLTKHQVMPKKASKISNSFKKIMKSVFGSSTYVRNYKSSPSIKPACRCETQKESFFVYNGSKSVRFLTSIPEVHENDELGKMSLYSTPVVRRAASERFTTALVSGSCPSRY